MKLLRTVLFWTHLAGGVSAGLVILIMSATGAALALKPQIVNFIDRDVRTVMPENRPRLPISQIQASAREARPDATVGQITVDRDPSRAVAVGLERAGTIYINPYNGALLGEGSPRAQAIFRSIENWHRWVGLPNENRAIAKSITGAANFAFLGLALSGLYVWWPRKWTPQHTRAILAFRRTSTRRARDFNWHNVIGFWCAPVIIIMTTTALVLSYPWANTMLFRLAGSEPPAASREQPQRPVERRAAVAAPTATEIDRAWVRAETQMPTWSVISMRASSGAVAFTLTDGAYWNAYARSQLTVNASSGEVQRWQPYSESTRGQKVRGWFRFAHTGELGGLTGQVLAGIACAGGVVLVWTGLALAFRRLINWKLWKAFQRDRSVVPALRAES